MRDSAIHCRNCGEHVFSFEALRNLRRLAQDRATHARIGHAVRKIKPGARVSAAQLDNFADNMALPGPLERIDQLVLHLATDFEPGQATELRPSELRAIIGTVTTDQAKWAIEQAMRLNLISGQVHDTINPTRWRVLAVVLTIEGWKHHAELMKAGAASRHAFMAMSFGDQALWDLYRGPMREAVQQTGFELRTLAGDHQTAGSIDNRMRVEIRTSRFVVCDLSHGNQGAYWEAGFAEGLGRPVFYICRAELLGKPIKDGGPHFDTAHQLIIKWDPTDIGAFQTELKNAIRATLPGDATLED